MAALEVFAFDAFCAQSFECGKPVLLRVYPKPLGECWQQTFCQTALTLTHANAL